MRAKACDTPNTSVLSPTNAPSSVQNVLHAPTRAQISVLRVTDPSTASLCGTVTLPAPPVVRCIARTCGRASALTRSATYTASNPSARNAALCIAGDSEWVTGSPMTTRRRVLAPISTFAFGSQPVRDGRGEGLELLAGVAIDIQVAAERIAHFIAAPAGVLAEDEDAAFPTELVDAGSVMTGHRENKGGVLHQLAGEQAGAMTREIEPALKSDKVSALGCGGAIPRAGAGGRDSHVEPAFPEGALQQRSRQRAAANIAGANEQDVLGHGARRPTARRNSAMLSVPSRTICACGRVQSTTVDGGRFPSTPPSSTSSFPSSTARAKSRAMAAAPGPGGCPGTFADVDVNGPPKASTRDAIA